MKKVWITLAMAFFVTANLCAQKSEVFAKNDIAINGYDAVAYFKDNKPVKGMKTFLYQWHDASWLFSTKENLETFSHDPGKYAPQYGGYCAYATSQGHKAPTEPDAWTIVNGKLYLNYNKDVQELWSKDKEGYIQKADKNWPGIKDKE